MTLNVDHFRFLVLRAILLMNSEKYLFENVSALKFGYGIKFTKEIFECEGMEKYGLETEEELNFVLIDHQLLCLF